MKKFLSAICLVLATLAVTSTEFSHVQAQAVTENFYSIGFTTEGIKFYGYTDTGALVEVGSLPSNISVQDLNPTAEWTIDSRLHLSVSPNGQYIAFTAKRNTEAALFIYMLANATLEQTPVVSSTLTPLWSPDSEAIALAPWPLFRESRSPYPETFIYDQTSELLSQITNSPNFIETQIRWLPDSSGIVYATRCESPCGRGINDIYVSDRQGNNQLRLTDLTALLPAGTFLVNTCRLVWNPINDRWYFQVGCLSLSDRPQDQVFSTNLQGDTRHELVLQNVFTDELIMSRAIESIGIAADGGVYIGVYIDAGIAADWYLSKLTVPGQAQTVFSQRFEGNSWSELDGVVFSPSSKEAIMIGIDSPGRDQSIRLIDTTSGQVVFQHTVPGPKTVCGVHWIDSESFVFEETLNGCNVNAEVQNVWLVDTTANTVTNASQGIGNLVGLLRQPEKQPPIANAGPDQTVTDSDSSGSELVTLDGSASTDTDGTIVSYSWTENGIEIATGVSPQVNLAVGVHTIILTVIDDDGASDVDDVVITVEASSAPTPTDTPTATPTATPTPTETPTGVGCDSTIPASDTAALVSAIATGNSAGAPYTICLTNSTYTLNTSDNSIDGSNGLPSVTGDITITGNGATITRDPAAASFRIFHVAELGSLTLENVTLSNGVATGTTSSGDGGAIRNRGTLTVNNSNITGNSAGNDGGGVYNNNSLTISGSTISNNTAADDGGGVINEGSTATALIQNSMIQDNQATGVGGGVNNTDGTLTVTGTTVTTNTSSSNGGGVYNVDGTVNVSNSSLTNNTANDFGGGLHDESGSTTLNQTTVSGNHALSNGGGLASSSSVITIENNSFITSNNADSQGGGVYTAGSSGQVLIANSTVEDNSSVTGGGVYVSSSTVTIRTSIVRNNIVTEDGGGIRNSGTLIIEQGSSLTGNQAGDDGAGTENSGVLTISGSIFSTNTAVDDGGGIRNTGGTASSSIHGSCFQGNSADAGSGVFSTASGLNATDNWWGAADGPSGSGSGSGDAVNGNVLFSPFLTTGCPVGGG